MADMIREVVRARGDRRLVVSARLPGATGKAMAAGGGLPYGPGLRGTQTFADWVTEQRGRVADGARRAAVRSSPAGALRRPVAARAGGRVAGWDACGPGGRPPASLSSARTGARASCSASSPRNNQAT
jgi:hypothetical protein